MERIDESDVPRDVFIEVVVQGLRSAMQRAAFARYAVGLLSPVERKSIEPIASQTRPDAADYEHQALQCFIADAP